MASEPEEGTGHMSWTSVQSVEVGAGSGKGGAKQYCMALSKQEEIITWKNEQMVDHTCFEIE